MRKGPDLRARVLAELDGLQAGATASPGLVQQWLVSEELQAASSAFAKAVSGRYTQFRSDSAAIPAPACSLPPPV